MGRGFGPASSPMKHIKYLTTGLIVIAAASVATLVVVACMAVIAWIVHYHIWAVALFCVIGYAYWVGSLVDEEKA